MRGVHGLLTPRGRLALLLAVGVYVAAWALGTREAYALALALALAVGAAVAYVKLAVGPFGLDRRHGRGERVEGGTLDMRVVLRADGGILPATGTLRETLPGGRRVEVPLQRRPGRLVGRYAVRGLPRGRHRLDEAELAIEDPLGLARGVATLPGAGTIVVYPRIVELDRMLDGSGGPNGVAGRYMLSHGAGFDLHSVRDHQNGESLRRVHWPSTARRQKLMVKELEESPRDEAAVVLDARAGFDVGTPPDSSFELAVRAAGSLVRRLAMDGQRAALVVSGAQIERVPVQSLEGDWQAALDLLAGVRADGRRPLSAVVSETRAGLDALRLYLVTSDLTPQLGDRVAQIAARRRIQVVWVDARSFAEGETTVGVPDGVAMTLARRGVGLVRLRRGDDLAAVLGGGAAGRGSSSASAGAPPRVTLEELGV